MGQVKVDLLREQLEFARDETLKLAKGVPAGAHLYQPAEGRPTALWLLGHLANTINTVVLRYSLRAEHAFPKEYAKIFAPDLAGGDPPTTDATKYPPFEEVARLYEHVLTTAITALSALQDEDLDKPLPVELPERAKAIFPTIGKALQRLVAHDAYHRGQMAMLAKIAK